MKKTTSFILALTLSFALVSGSAIAAPKKVKKTTTTTAVKSAPAETASESSSSRSHSSSPRALKFEAGVTFGSVASAFGYGIKLEGKYPFQCGPGTLWAGLETGWVHTSSEPFPGFSIYSNFFPILPTGTFEYEVNSQYKVYGGLGLGLAVGSGGVSGVVLPGFVSTTSTGFMWKLKPGAIMNDMWFAEIPIGTISGSFYFTPTVGVRF